MSKQSGRKARERQKRSYERQRLGERDTVATESPAGTAAEPPQREAHTSVREGLSRMRGLKDLSRSATQNALIVCCLAVAVWSVVYFEAGLGALDLLGYYQTDIVMGVVRMGAMVAACAFAIRAAIDTWQMPQVLRGWGFVPLGFAFLDVLFMMIPGGSEGSTSATGALVLAVINFVLGIVVYVLCARVAREHPEATDRYREDRAAEERRMAGRAQHPIRSVRRRIHR